MRSSYQVHFDILNCLGVAQECDGRTNRQTDRHNCQ